MINAFGDGADFTGATFGDGAYFTGAAFGLKASFDDTCFKGLIDFAGGSKEKWRRYIQVWADVVDEKGHEESWKRWNSGPDRFLTVSFASAHFDGDAGFIGRTFEMDANFTNARFYRPPDFHGADHVDWIDFTGAYIGFGRLLRPHWTTDAIVPLRLRTLRKIAEETKNHNLERDLYIEERKAERGVYWRQLIEEWKKAPIIEKPPIAFRLGGHCLWIVVMLFYWALSNYGRSFVWPFAWLIASVFFFDWRYTNFLAPLMAKASAFDVDKYKQAVGMLALGNAVPFVGPLTIDSEVKKFLFCPSGGANCLPPPIPPEGFQLLVIAQNVLSIILVFFIGLALRNYFKIK